MADEARVTQAVIETASKVDIAVRETQNVIEIMAPIPIEVRETQNVIETGAVIQTTIRQTQNIIEYIKGSIDLSGIYFINPAINHDIYYGDPADPLKPAIHKKIPDPTVRLPLLGD